MEGARRRRRRDPAPARLAAEPPPPGRDRERLDAVRPPRRDHDGEPLLRQRARRARALRPAEGERAALQPPRRGARTATRAPSGPVRSFPFATTAQGAARLPELERHPPSRSTAGRMDGFVSSVENDQPMGYWTDGRAARSSTRSRSTLLRRQPLVLLGALPDLSQPPLPDGGHRLREHLDRQRKPHRPAAAERHDLGPPARLRGQLEATTSPTCPRRGSSPRRSRSTRRTSPRSPQFFADCAAGTLPSVSLVDPEFGVAGDVGSALATRARRSAPIAEKLETTGGDEENPQDMSYGEYWAYEAVNAVLRVAGLAAHAADLHLRRARRLLRPRAAAGGDRARLDPAEARPGDVPGGYDIYGPRVPAIVASPYSQAERGHERRPRPHLGARHDRGQVEPAARSPTATPTRRP